MMRLTQKTTQIIPYVKIGHLILKIPSIKNFMQPKL